MMTSRERVLQTLQFQRTDRVPYDLARGTIWPELAGFFQAVQHLDTEEKVWEFLEVDFRWIRCLTTLQDEKRADPGGTASRTFTTGPLQDAQSVADIEAFELPEASVLVDVPDYGAFARKWPEHARVVRYDENPLFWRTCELFGMEQAMLKIAQEPEIYESLVRKLTQFMLARRMPLLEKARPYADICLLWDDFAGQHGMMISPLLWRRHLKPHLARIVAALRDCGFYVMFHSCGSVSPILEDLIEIGVHALEVFQVNAAGMHPQKIAGQFGGRLAFYGGIDVQHLLSFGSAEDVERQVQYNIDCFRECGGYIVANSHTRISSIQGENLIAMCRAARSTPLGDVRRARRAHDPCSTGRLAET